MQEVMFEISKLYLLPPICFMIPLLTLFIIKKYLIFASHNTKTFPHSNTKFPKCYPIIGHLIAFVEHELNGTRFEWLSSLVVNSPSATFVTQRPFKPRMIVTGNPENVEHILKTRFSSYPKGVYQKIILTDLLGDGIFNVDGEKWKFQRRVACHEFSTKSLQRYVETVVDVELSDRLIPILSDACDTYKVLDMQDVLQRFAFDNICKIAFGYDPEYLSPSFPEAKFAVAFENAVMIIIQRTKTLFPYLWKVYRFLNVGSEKKLKAAILEIQEFANALVRQKKQEIEKHSDGFSPSAEVDLLSRFMNSSHSNENFVTDIVISFILAGRDTTSSALTWFFWLLHENKQVEEEIVREIFSNNGKQSDSLEHSSVFDEVKDRVYIHAALCESMRLYPPVPVDTKEASVDDVLPDGTRVQKGDRVTYHPYAMGRMESIWGHDWAEYRPQRWLEVEEKEETGERKWKFVPRDPYSYPVFQAGPRICLGKEMAFLQMKRVVNGILERFRVVPLVEKGVEPILLPHVTAKMKGGLPVRIEERKIIG